MSVACPDENLILAHIDGKLSTGEAEELDSHLDICSTCRHLVGDLVHPHPSMLITPSSQKIPDQVAVDFADPMNRPLLRPGATIGRYHILRWVGSGGMGVVYAAYDPALDRRIALKLLRPEWQRADNDGRALLQREAKSLARLSHPNVVTIYDVGALGDQLFIAMEFVDGQTMRSWLRSAPRSPERVLALFRQAGEGLAAAHRAGLVHRDFKPDNILIGSDDTVRVTDFGLARAVDTITTQERMDGGDTLPSMEQPSREIRNTTGTLAGTPTYMAPELFNGTSADARADQYAFCVSLHESLYGQPTGAVRRGGTWIQEVLQRGLQPDPARRFPSMSALLDALAVDPRALRRRQIQGAALLALLLATGFSARALIEPNRRKGPCQNTEALLRSVWDDKRRNIAQEALLRSAIPGGRAAWSRVSTALDQYANRWAAHRREICESALRGELSNGLRDLRMQCLDQRRNELQALTSLFMEGTSQAAQKAEQAVGTLTQLGTCINITLLSAPEPEPTDPTIRARLTTLRQQQARIKELTDTDRFSEALTLAHTTLAAARSVGYRPLVAELMVTDGNLLRITAERDNEAMVTSETEKTFRNALRIAESSRHDLAKLDAMIALIHVLNYKLRLPEAEQVVDDARATLERIGGDERRATAVDLAYSRILMNQGRHAESEHLLTQRERVAGPPNLDIVDILLLQGLLRLKQGRFLEAEDRFRRAMVIQEQMLGPQHSHVANSALGLTDALRMQGRLVEAEAVSRRALALTLAHASTSSLSVALAYGTLAEVLVGLGCAQEALENAQKAVLTIRVELGPTHPTTWEALLTLAQAQSAAGQHREARQTARQVVTYVTKERPAGHVDQLHAQAILQEVLNPEVGVRVARHPLCNRPPN